MMHLCTPTVSIMGDSPFSLALFIFVHIAASTFCKMLMCNSFIFLFFILFFTHSVIISMLHYIKYRPCIGWVTSTRSFTDSAFVFVHIKASMYICYCVIRWHFSYGCTHYVLLCCFIPANKVFSKTVVHSVSLEGNSRLYLSFWSVVGWLKCCFTSTETVALLGTGTQDVHLDFHTAPEL